MSTPAKKQTVLDMLASNASVADILAAGYSVDDMTAGVRSNLETSNRKAQAALDYTTKQPPKLWADRKAWLLDGQPIHGELKEFFWPAITALQADDQAEYSKQRDLLFKALRTFLGDPPPPAPAPDPTPAPTQGA